MFLPNLGYFGLDRWTFGIIESDAIELRNRSLVCKSPHGYFMVFCKMAVLCKCCHA